MSAAASPDKKAIITRFQPGTVLARKYEIVSHVGSGADGELFWLNECATGIERTAKIFNPSSNTSALASWYARKLHRLRHCNILMQYRTQETVTVRGMPVTFLVSEFVNGTILRDFIASQPHGRLPVFEALHLLYALTQGIEQLHLAGESHGNLTIDNIMIKRKGLSFKAKLLDLHDSGHARQDSLRNDVAGLIRIFYEAIGGARYYRRLPDTVREICCGARRPQILARYRHAGMLRERLESLTWR